MKPNTTFIYVIKIFIFLFITGNANISYAKVVYTMELEFKALGIGNMLKWETSFESDSDVFRIEKSTDGLTFTEIGEVPAAGFSAYGKNYYFLDTSISVEKRYYRLKLIEKEGAISYSRIAIVQQTVANQFMIAFMSISPESDFFHFSIDVLAKGTINYSLYNRNGELLNENKIPVVSGVNHINVDLSEMTAGSYKITFRKNKEVEEIMIRKSAKENKTNPGVAKSGQHLKF